MSASTTSSGGMRLAIPARGHVRRRESVGDAHGVALDAWDFHRSGHRIADEPEKILEGDGRRVDNLFRSPAAKLRQPRRRHGRSHADFGLATADRPGNGGTHGHEYAHRRRDEQPVDDGVVAEPAFLSRRKKRAGQHPAGPRRGSRHHTAHGTVVLHDRQRTATAMPMVRPESACPDSTRRARRNPASPGTRPASMSLFPASPSVIDAFMISQLPSTAARIVSRSTPLRRAS